MNSWDSKNTGIDHDGAKQHNYISFGFKALAMVKNISFLLFVYSYIYLEITSHSHNDQMDEKIEYLL